MNQGDTKTRILEAAERLFAENGIAATSLRAITAAAGVNLAAVNYHFQSKEALVHAVYARRLEPVNRARLEMLDAQEARAGGGSPPLEEIMDAFVAPFLRGFMGTPFTALMGRMYVEPGDFARRFLGVHMREVARRFGAALRRALPGLPEEEMFWRMHFAVGALAHTLAGGKLIEILSEGRCTLKDEERIRRRMVTFLCAGLRAEPGESI
ncbi:MAG: TetR/AcrR family transcriptional regulator [Acidobacteria bacterium]|nr:TetR/AcrR family transcriptional regulator [Acidobacteriota bacterium]